MRNFLALTKVQFFAFLGLNKAMKGKKGKKVGAISGMLGALILYAALIVFVSVTYSEMFAETLILTDSLDLLLPLMLAMSALISFFFSFYTTTGALYGFKDYEFLASLPIKTNVVVASKLVFMYVSDLFFAVCVMVPAAFIASTYGVLPNGLGIVSLAIITIVSPALPIAISVLIGGIVAFVSSRFRKKNLVQIIIWVLILLSSFAVGFFSGMDENYNPFMTIAKVYFIMDTAALAITNPLYLLLFLAENLLPLVLVALLVSLTYSKMHVLLTAKKRNKKYKFTRTKILGAKKALFKRELKTFFSIPTYVINSLFGGVFAVIGMVAAAVIFNILGVEMGVNVAEAFVVFLPLLLSFSFMISPSTACSISVEGESFWLVRTLPVTMNDVFNMKLAVNAVLATIPAVVGAVAFSIISKLNLVSSVIFICYALFITLLGGNVGLVMNILFPMMKWDNPVQPVKQGASIFLSVLIGFIYTGGQFLIVYFVGLPPQILMGLCLAITVILTIVTYLLIYTKGERLLLKKIG